MNLYFKAKKKQYSDKQNGKKFQKYLQFITNHIIILKVNVRFLQKTYKF